jgi:hypothetical protein
MPDATQTPVNAPESPAKWISVRAAALALGVSARAIQKRAARGTLAARKVEKDGASVWEVDGRELGANMDAATKPTPTQNSVGLDANPGANPRTDGREPSATLPDFATKYVAQLESENEFLRRALESAQQSESITKAALREALRAMPKAIAAGDSSARIEADAPQNGDGRQSDADATNGPQNAPNRAASLDSISDFLESLER